LGKNVFLFQAAFHEKNIEGESFRPAEIVCAASILEIPDRNRRLLLTTAGYRLLFFTEHGKS
jgi:hypothetical protein